MDIKLTTNSIIHCTKRQQYNDEHITVLSTLPAESKLINTSPTDVYYHGDLDRGKEIIAALQKLGGNNNYLRYSAKNKNMLYYISKDNNYIKCCDPEKDEELTSFITRFYKMLTLPPIELIEIEGKKYRKEEVFEKLKDLKTY